MVSRKSPRVVERQRAPKSAEKPEQKPTADSPSLPQFTNSPTTDAFDSGLGPSIASSISATPDPPTTTSNSPAGIARSTNTSPLDRPIRRVSSDFSGVTGANSPINVSARQAQELTKEVTRMRKAVSDFKSEPVAENTRLRRENLSSIKVAKRHLKTALMEKPANANKINKFESVVKGLGQERDLLMQNLHKFKGREAKVRTYPKLLDQHDSLGGDFEKKYDLIMPGRREAIKVVAQKLKRENSNPAQSFAVLGRTPDTFGRTGDPARDSKSWINQNPNEAGRVLSTPDWSLAVNDAFIDAGLGEKSQFALVTPYKQEVLAKLKELLNNPTGLTREQIKMKIKKFVKEKNEPALYSGNTEHNEGYNISMNELEQIIDDNYVVMQHDTKAGEKDPGRLTPTAVMVPSGKGQTIKEELEKAVSLRRSRSAASLGSILEQDPALKKKGP